MRSISKSLIIVEVYLLYSFKDTFENFQRFELGVEDPLGDDVELDNCVKCPILNSS